MLVSIPDSGKMTRIQREGEPQVIEQSAVVNRLLKQDLKYISNSKENSIIFFSEKNTNVLYGFRYFDQVFERKLASWFKWTFTETVQYHCMQDDSLYLINSLNDSIHLYKFSIKRENETPFVSYFYELDSTTKINSNIKYRVHLDNLTKVSTNSGGVTASYNSTTNRTTISNTNLPDNIVSGFNLVAYDNDEDGTTLGRFSVNTTPYANF